MTLPDPHPRAGIDSPGEAIHRRLPTVGRLEATNILHMLKALEPINIPVVTGTTTQWVIENLRQWITPQGREALGMGRASGGTSETT